MTKPKLVKSKDHTLSCLSIRSFLFSMSEFLYQTNRMENSIDDLVDTTQEQKTEHIFKVLCEWPSAREQLRLENIYDPKSGINLGNKLWTNQQYSALKVYNKLHASTEDILEKILEREGTLDFFYTKTSSLFPVFSSSNLNEIEEELKRSARTHGISKEHRYQIQLLKQGTFSCTTDLWDEMSSSTEYNYNTSLRDEMSASTKYNFMFQKFKAMTLFEFLDKYPLPTNSKEVEEQSSGRVFRFLHSLNTQTLQLEVKDSLDSANSFWNIPDIKSQLTTFIDGWAYDRNFNNRYCFGFVDCLIELMWIRERMLAAKNMNATKRNIFWDRINLKHDSDVRWLFNEVKDRPSIFLNILRGTVSQLTENNESEIVTFTLDDLMELEFKTWLCICEHEYLKLLNVTLFEKMIDHNLIHDHDSFVIQEIINSGMLMIILAILKLFIDDRNSFSHEQWEKLHQIRRQPTPMVESVITQSKEEVKTDPVHMTSTITSTENYVEEPKGREKLCTRVMNETTLRIFCLKKSNTEPFTQDFSTPIAPTSVQDTTMQTKDFEEAKVLKEKTDTEG